MIKELKIIDAHHHLWDLEAHYYPWLTDQITERVCGEYSAIRKNYTLQDFMTDAMKTNLVKSIHVQAICADALAETQWLQEIADSPDSKGFPHGIVAYADFSNNTIEEDLEKQISFKNVVGVRQMLHEGQVKATRPKPSHLENPKWCKNFSLLKKYNLTFDLQVYSQQMSQASQLLTSFPNIQFVLCHTGQPADRTPEGIMHWKKNMELLAKHENLVVKISGLGMFDRHWTSDSISPFVLHTIDVFGVNRCLFGSNFPVDGMMTSYTRLWKSYSDITRGFSEYERHHLFYQNSEIFYLNNKKRNN